MKELINRIFFNLENAIRIQFSFCKKPERKQPWEPGDIDTVVSNANWSEIDTGINLTSH